MTSKEESDLQLVLKLRKEGLITTPGSPFEVSQKQEIDGLIARGVFHFEQVRQRIPRTRNPDW
jgi:hypothetical protein